MVVICRIDLDGHDALFIAKLYAAGIITLGEAAEAKCCREMTEVNRLLWLRQVKSLRPEKPSEAKNPNRANHMRWVV